MNAGPLVSVILPVYNGELFVAQTVESALQQTYRNLEIIIVNDGSTDQTGSVVHALAERDPRIRVFHQPNCGVARARNLGLAEARGEYVAPLDGDDLWEPHKIEQQVRLMEQGGEAVGLVYCWWVWIDQKGRILDRSPSWEIEGDASDLLLQVNFTGNASVPLYRRRCLQAVGGYDESMERHGGRGCEDWDVALKVAARSKVAVAKQLLVGYRRLPDSMSTQCEVMWRSQQLLTRGAIERNPDVDRHLLQRSSDQFAMYVAGVLFRCGDYVRSARWALRAWRTGLLFHVLPYALLALFKRVFLSGRSSAGTMRPGQALDQAKIAPPLIPYDRMYAQNEPPQGSGILRSAAVQALVLILASAFIAALHWDNDGLGFQGDSPRHAMNGLFWYDLATAGTTDVIGFATRYYARYPVINPVSYPPLFYLLEGAAFRIFGPVPQAAKALVLLFGLMAGGFSIAWARRWLGPAYGWAGVCMAFLPGIVVWSNAVMLNVPTLALGMAGLYYVRSWIESGAVRQAVAGSLFGFAAFLTYFPGGIAFVVAAAWAIFLRHGRHPGRLPVAPLSLALVSLIPILLALMIAPAFVQRNLPAWSNFSHSDKLLFYPVNLRDVVGTLPLVMGLLGVVLGMRSKIWRRETQFVVLWILLPLAVFTLLPAKDTRYVLIVAPAFLMASAIGISSLAGYLRLHSVLWQVAFLAGVLASGAWSASRIPILEKSGFRVVAAYLRTHAPEDAVLYDGYHDGLFGFYLRASDPDFRRRLVLGQQVLYRYGPAETFEWVDALKHSQGSDSVHEIVRTLRTESGCRWLAIEIGSSSEWAAGQRLLRQAVTGSEFELVKSFPVNAWNARRVDLYRQRGPVQPVSRVDLNMPSLGSRSYRGVLPITR
jgi:hypothetical protein